MKRPIAARGGMEVVVEVKEERAGRLRSLSLRTAETLFDHVVQRPRPCQGTPHPNLALALANLYYVRA